MKKGWAFLAVVLIVVAYLLPSPLSGASQTEPQRYTASVTAATTPPLPTPPRVTIEPFPSMDPALLMPPTQRPVATPAPETHTYVLNTNSKKFHYPTCSSVNQMKDSNKWYYEGTRDEVIAMGYDPCGRCHP